MEEIDTSVNKSLLRQNMMCNHCRYNCKSYEDMKEHYKSDFHKYNLNRVTMNLAPITYEDYLEKKKLYQKKAEELKKQKEEKEADKPVNDYFYCDKCQKKFLSRKKLNEHYNSKLHLKNANKKENEEITTQSEITTESTKKEPTDIKTTLDDISICLFCNYKNENLEQNIFHMINVHHLDIPFLFCIKNYTSLIKLLAKKIFTYHACLYCDTQKFSSNKALQSHMIDKNHTSINHEDLDEFLYKYYNMQKLLSLKDTNIRKTREFKILWLRYKISQKQSKDKPQNNEDEWEEVDESDEEDDKEESQEKKKEDIDDDGDFEPMTLPNGELLLEDGTILGNKIYNIYYKQRIKTSKYEELQKQMQNIFTSKRKAINNHRSTRRKKQNDVRYIHNHVIKGSTKHNYKTVNSLFTVRPQVVF